MSGNLTQLESSMPPTSRQRRLVWIRRIYDLFLYISALVGVFVSYIGVISPQNTYVQCDDPSLSHEVKKDTISIMFLIMVTLFGPLTLMTLFEWHNLLQENSSSAFRKGARRAYSFFLSLMVGGLFSFFVIEVLKTAVSEPRPNFMNGCKPNFTKEQCDEPQPWVHITAEDCTNPLNFSYYKLIDSMKSFPSGHACLGVFGATYMTIYIQRRVRLFWSRLFKVWFQFAWWLWALFCCTSRVWDKKHHWWDVAFGGVLGLVSGFVTAAYLCNCFGIVSNKKYSKESLPVDNVGENLPQLATSKDQNGLYPRSSLEMEENVSNHTASEPMMQRLVE